MKMINPLSRTLAFAFGTFLLVSCASTVPFSQQIRKEYQLSEQELKSIQFYISDDLVLQNADNDAKAKSTSDGKLTVKSGQSVSEIVIPEGTPGVTYDVIDGDRISVKFGNGPKDYLVFAAVPKMRGYYALQALKWEGTRAMVNYGDNPYWTNPGADRIYLRLEMRSIRSYKRETTVVKGQRVHK